MRPPEIPTSRMLTDAEVPPILKRTHIVSGYRPMNQPAIYYYFSAFSQHNELINVWTHFLPAIVLLYFYLIPELLMGNARFPVLALHSGIICLLLCSSLAHLLHSRSPLDHIYWFMVDFAGIALFGVAIGVQRWACEEDLHTFWLLTYIPLHMAVGLGLFFLSSSYLFVCRTLWKKRHLVRMVTCLSVALFCQLPVVHRYWTLDAGPDVSLSLHTRAFIWLLFSGIFLGANVPERFAPGVFDIYGYGHQLFHLCVNMVAWNLCDAADLDCSHRSASLSSTKNLCSLASLILSCVFILVVFRYLMTVAKRQKYD